MGTRDFSALVKQGERGTAFFIQNFDLLSGLTALNLNDIQDWHIEGSDFTACVIRWIENHSAEIAAELAEDLKERCNGGCFIPEIVFGGGEVKTISAGKFIHRNDLGGLREPALPFAIWNGKENGQFARNKHGWLRRLFQPEAVPFSSEPLVLGFVAECLDNQCHQRQFASISFPDFLAFKRRLVNYAADNGLDLENWDTIPVGKDAENFECGSLIIKKNVWYVPLSILVDIARIVIIGDPPMFYRNGSCSAQLQADRYRYLCEHAAAHVSMDEIKEEADAGSMHPLFDLMLSEMKPTGLRGKDGKLLSEIYYYHSPRRVNYP